MNEERDESRLDRIESGIEKFFQGMLELQQSQKKTDEQLNRTGEQILELKESQKKTDEQLSRTIRKLDDIGRQLGDLGLVQGEVAEELFYRNVESLFRKQRMMFRQIRRNVRRKGTGEFDIVAANGELVLVIEVKNKLAKRMVDEFINVKLRRFREAFPEYRGYRLLGGIGALVVKDDVGRYAEKAGLYVLIQTSEGGAALLNRDDFTARDFN